LPAELRLSIEGTGCAWKATLLPKSRALVYQEQKAGRDNSVTNSFSLHYISHVLVCFVFTLNVFHLAVAGANESLHNKQMTDSQDCVRSIEPASFALRNCRRVNC
jgi:hypothetical protein